VRVSSHLPGVRGRAGQVPSRGLSALREEFWPATMVVVGLIDQLGYRIPEANRLQRLVWKVSSSRPGAWLFAKSLHHIDRLVLRLSRERVTVPGVLAGLPVLTLASTGARSGQRREVPLVGVPTGEQIAVIGTRFGQPRTPGWYFNLRAEPRAEVGYRGRTVPVVAREAEGDEREAVWARGCQIYAGYQAYARRLDHRQIHVMVLEPPPEG
jgi:deazaflavin-dependent oxidoreductase (nitroreductase family)